MTALGAWRDGVRRVAAAPFILIGAWALTVAVSLPLALVIRDRIETHLGSSLAADNVAAGVNVDWMQEFADGATGLGATVRPTILGFAAVLDNLSAFLDNDSRPLAVVLAIAVYLVSWLFVAGGILDRYARGRRVGAHGFFSVSGVFFFRFLRLSIVMLAVYGVLFGYVHTWLFDRAYPWLTRDLTVERTAFAVRGGCYLVFGALVGACTMLFDYAKIRAVVEDRRSMLGALVSAARFVRRNAAAAAALFLINFALFAATVMAYALVAPGAGRAGWAAWAGFVVGQFYVGARLCVKLLFWASATALFQGRLAHAGYVAAEPSIWPDSPSVEALRRRS